MLRTRRITKPAFPIPGAKVCDECGRPKKIKRNHAGRSYCDACYQREFVHMPCAGCGETCRAKRGTAVPYCSGCETENRRCKGCGRPVRRAGMYHEGEVVCPSCVPKYKPKEPCPACGEPSSRLSRVGSEGDAICDHCRNGRDHATCATCGRYRRQADKTAAKPICVECVEGITHICPDCVKDVPGGGESRCRECAARARGRAQVEACCETLHQTWVQDLFRRHCEADLLSAPRGDVVRRIGRAAAFFEIMDASMANAATVTPDNLLKTYGPEGLRRASKAVLFLTNTLQITWSPGTTDDFAERRRIETMLDEVSDRNWGREIVSYAAALRSETRKRALQQQTIRMYLRAAIALMEHCQKDAVSDLTAADCRRFEALHRGHCASLSPFYAWASLPPSTAVRLTSTGGVKARENALLAKSKMLMNALESSTSRTEGMALTAALISSLYGKPLRSVLKLRAADFSGESQSSVRLGGDQIRLDERLAKALARWARHEAGELVFVSPRRPGAMSESAVAHHIKAATTR